MSAFTAALSSHSDTETVSRLVASCVYAPSIILTMNKRGNKCIESFKILIVV